jgi:co-chaperonin GroES (HSP10)
MKAIADIEVFGNTVLVRVLDPNRVTPGGIIKPETAQDDDVPKAEVVAVGPGLPVAVRESDGATLRFEMPFKPGDIVDICGTGRVHYINGEKLVLIGERDITVRYPKAG